MENHAKDLYRVAILVDTTTSWSRSLIQGILDYTKIHGPWYLHLEPQPRTDRLYLPPKWKGHGIIARVSSRKIADDLEALKTPVVNISSVELEGVHLPRVITSPTSQSKLALQTFRTRGFSNFAFVGDLTRGYIQRHFQNYKQTLEQAGYSLLYHSTRCKSSLEDWLESLPKPVGVLCWGPSLGHSVIDSCQSAGIPVPHDVAVLGTNYDELLSESSYPPQAGILMATKEIGLTAASILHGLMQGAQPRKMEWHLEPKGVVEKLSIDTMAVKDRRLASVMRFLRDHALEPITVDDILKANPMARRSLERKFKRIFGCTIVEEVRHIRINHARKLLSETEEPISLISETCGFSSYTYLNRIFKKVTGLSPSQFRAQCRAQHMELSSKS